MLELELDVAMLGFCIAISTRSLALSLRNFVISALTEVDPGPGTMDRRS